MQKPEIINRGRGPEIAGTRITVYAIYEYARAGQIRDEIAVMLDLSSDQVQAALDYIDEHREEIEAAYEKIMARIRRGNPTWVEELLKQNRPKFEAFVARCRAKAVGENRHAGGPL